MKSINKLIGVFLGFIVGVFLLTGTVRAADVLKKAPQPPVAKCAQCQSVLDVMVVKKAEMNAFDKKYMGELKAKDMKEYRKVMLAKTILKEEKAVSKGRKLTPKESLVQDAVLKACYPEMYKLEQEFKDLVRKKLECEKNCPTK